MSNSRIFPIPMGTLEPSDYYTKSEVDALISDFITNTVDDLVNYYTKSETYTQTEVDALIGAISQFHYEIYPTLASVTDPQTNVLYLIGPSATATGDLYEEYVYSNSTFVKIGDTSIDLSGYVTTTDLNTALADYTPTADLATVATTGAYSDLSGTPNLATVATSGSYTDLTNTPNLATVATTGAYSDLSGTPTLATVATTGDYTDLTNTPSLATVATTGDYDDLTNKPTIPTVNDATITITQGGATKGTFTLNQSSNQTIDVDAGGGSQDWFGTQAQFDALTNKDADTNYWISDKIRYSEIKGTPDVYTKTQINATVSGLEGEIAEKTAIKFMSAQEYAAATKREGETYAVQGETVQLTFTLSDQTTVTHNFVIDD